MTGTGFIDRIGFVLPNITGTMPGTTSNVENTGSVLSASALGVQELLH